MYQIGTFAQIHELQDMGDKLRLVVMAHRRIRVTGQIADTEEAPAGKCSRDYVYLKWYLAFLLSTYLKMICKVHYSDHSD